jgi:hypothetical protein
MYIAGATFVQYGMMHVSLVFLYTPSSLSCFLLNSVKQLSLYLAFQHQLCQI